MLQTLELNKASVPVGIISAKRALIAVCNKRAIALANYDKVYHSSDYICMDLNLVKGKNSLISIPIPSVIRFIDSDFMPKRYTNILPFNRMNVYIRDSGTCCYCGKKVSISNFTFDHVIPRADGGKSCWENVVVSCVKCNNQKDRIPLHKFSKKLIKKPYVPHLTKAAPEHLVSRIAMEIPHETWLDYIYWRIELEE